MGSRSRGAQEERLPLRFERSLDGHDAKQSLQNWIYFKLAETVIARNQREGTNAYLAAHIYWPPPLFVITVTLIQIGHFVHAYLTAAEPKPEIWWEFCDGCSGSSLLSLNPRNRQEVWRLFTYQFTHWGLIHLLSNVIPQLLFGVPLEIVHRLWRVGSLYLLGVFVGGLCAYVSVPSNFNVGASAGVYALVFAHFANLLLNWKEVPWRRTRLFFIFTVVVIIAVVGTVLFAWPPEPCGKGVKVVPFWAGILTVLPNGHAGHIGGALTGLLYGVFILRNVVVRDWEQVVRKFCLVVCAAFLLCTLWSYIAVEPMSEPFWKPCEILFD